jgi:hypothetical protein
MSRSNWQWDNRGSWKSYNSRIFWHGFNRAKSSEAKYHRQYRRGKLVGFFWGFLWCVQILLTIAVVRAILADHDVVVTRAATIAQ